MTNQILTISILIIAVFVGGFFLGRYWEGPSDPITIEKTVVKWKDKIVYREYEKMEYTDALKELKLYDTSTPMLEIYQIKNDEIKADASLHKREWTGTAKIHQDTNFNYYVGVGALCFVAGVALTIGALR